MSKNFKCLFKGVTCYQSITANTHDQAAVIFIDNMYRNEYLGRKIQTMMGVDSVMVIGTKFIPMDGRSSFPELRVRYSWMDTPLPEEVLYNVYARTVDRRAKEHVRKYSSMLLVTVWRKETTT